MAYNSFGQLIADYQEHAGAVDVGTTPVVEYGYADASANTIRPVSMTYPNGRTLNYGYGSAGGMNDALSRIGSLVDNDGVTQLANYSNLGQPSIVEVDEPQPGLTYTLLGLRPVACMVFFCAISAILWLGALLSAQDDKPTGEPKTLTVDLGGGVKMEFVRIPAGKFMMGSPKEEKERDDWEVQHEVTISKAFYLGKYEVTQEQYEAVTGENPSHFKKVDGEDTRRFPVEDVSWELAAAYCRKLTEKAGAGLGRFALPTEAQWEYACRAGTTTPYHFGNKLNGREANCNGNFPYGTIVKGRWLRRTCRVGSYEPNAWGLYDMHGNVLEWCKDWHGPYSGEKETDPTGAADGSYRVLRGGNWVYDARSCRAAYRIAFSPGYRRPLFGFRVALSLTISIKKGTTVSSQGAGYWVAMR